MGHSKLCENEEENMYSTSQIFKYAYRSSFMYYFVCSEVYIQNKKGIMQIGAVEVPYLEIGTRIVRV